MTGFDFQARLDPELRALVEARPPVDLSGDIPTLRAIAADLGRPLLEAMPEVPGVSSRDIEVDGYGPEDPPVGVRLYRPEGDASGAAMCFIHGGGMVFGSVAEMDYVCRRIVSGTGAVIASVEYRLAPEHPFPAPLHDCYAALRGLHDMAPGLGVDQSRIAVGGPSAGGGLAAGTAIMARDLGEVALCWQWLLYPMIDDRMVTPSSHEITEATVWNRAANGHGWAAYLGDLAGGDAVPIRAAPARASTEQLRGLPPTYIDVGDLDLFRDECIAYAATLLAAGVPTELHVIPGAFHGSEAGAPGADTSRRIAGYRNAALARFLGPR